MSVRNTNRTEYSSCLIKGLFSERNHPEKEEDSLQRYLINRQNKF